MEVGTEGAMFWRKVFVTKLQYHLFENEGSVLYNRSITKRL